MLIIEFLAIDLKKLYSLKFIKSSPRKRGDDNYSRNHQKTTSCPHAKRGDDNNYSRNYHNWKTSYVITRASTTTRRILVSKHNKYGSSQKNSAPPHQVHPHSPPTDLYLEGEMLAVHQDCQQSLRKEIQTQSCPEKDKPHTT